MVALLVERLSKGPWSQCYSTDVSSNPGCSVRWWEKHLAAPSVEHGNEHEHAVWELEDEKGIILLLQLGL